MLGFSHSKFHGFLAFLSVQNKIKTKKLTGSGIPGALRFSGKRAILHRPEIAWKVQKTHSCGQALAFPNS